MARSCVVRALTISRSVTHSVTVAADDASAAKNCTSLIDGEQRTVDHFDARGRVFLQRLVERRRQRDVLPEPLLGGHVRQAEMEPEKFRRALDRGGEMVRGRFGLDRLTRHTWSETGRRRPGPPCPTRTSIRRLPCVPVKTVMRRYVEGVTALAPGGVTWRCRESIAREVCPTSAPARRAARSRPRSYRRSPRTTRFSRRVRQTGARSGIRRTCRWRSLFRCLRQSPRRDRLAR